MARAARHDRRQPSHQISANPEPGDLLGQSHRADAEHLSGQQRFRLDARQHYFGDARRLFLEHAAQDVLAVDR